MEGRICNIVGILFFFFYILIFLFIIGGYLPFTFIPLFFPINFEFFIPLTLGIVGYIKDDKKLGIITIIFGIILLIISIYYGFLAPTLLRYPLL